MWLIEKIEISGGFLPGLNVHIPHFYGPLTPRACDESLAWAAAFFARYFPEERY